MRNKKLMMNSSLTHGIGINLASGGVGFGTKGESPIGEGFGDISTA